VTKAAIGVMGDLADTLGPSASPLFLQTVFYKDFLDECTSSDDQQLKETAEWALSTINRITNMG
jgi:importin subunit beta-1